jgi:polysaccharide biosynthesis transport protein
MSDQPVYVEQEEMTLRDYGSVVKRRKWLVIFPAVLVTAVALLMSLAQDDRYAAESDVLVKEPPSATAVGAPERPMQERVLQNELRRAQGSEMQSQVRAIVGSEPVISVRLAGSEDSDVFIFRAESADPELAAEAANVYAQVYIDERRSALTQDLLARAAVVQERLDRITVDLDGASDDERVDLLAQNSQYEFELEALLTSVSLAEQSGASVIDAAQVPGAPFEPNPARTALLALVVGLLIGLGAAFLVDYLDNSLRDEGDLAKATRLPVLAVIPKSKDWKATDVHVITREQPSSPPAEAYRALRTAVQFLGVDREMKVIQVTSPRPGEGKTTTSTNLAVACARAGQRVVLVDCDLRRPRIHAFFGLPNDKGFTTAMVGATFDEVAQKVDGEPNLSIISSGPIPPDPSELLSGRTASSFVRMLRDEVDLVVIDSPPVLVVADPLVVSRMVDGVILVASAERTDRRQVADAADQLAQFEAPVVGTVLNAYDLDSGSVYDYRYSYGRYDPVKS